MPIYRIADLNVEVNPKFKICRKRLESYAVKSNESGKTDIAISVSDDEIRERLRLSDNLSEQGAEDVLILSKFCNAVLDGFDGFFFHSSCLELDGEGYVFSAVSGTGKSTHTALWRRHFGNRVTMINDDKPIIRKKDGVFYVYGTPWMGKSNIGANISAPLGAVFLLERDRVNYAEKVSAGKVFPKLLEATLISKKQDRMSKILELYDEIFSAVDLYSLHCTISDDAVTAAYDAICK